MEYSASMVSCLFWLSETRKTASYILKGLSKDEIKEIAVNENIYQVTARDRSVRIFGVTYKRLQSLPSVIIQGILESDISTSKVLVLISIMKTDKLLFEFMHDVFRGNIILGSKSLIDRDINQFFNEKILQSDVVAKFSVTAIAKLKQCYSRMLYEAGLLEESSGDRKIKKVAIDYKIKTILEETELNIYLYSITGEK